MRQVSGLCPGTVGAVAGLARATMHVTARGGTLNTMSYLYREVARIRELAQGRESALVEEIWQLRATVARPRATSRVTST